MTIRHLKIFIAVCEHGSTTRAAEALYIVQPTVSHAISELERYYKAKLFDRINQRLILTDVGRALLVKAKEIIAGFDEFESLATSSGQSPRVRIGASLTMGQTLIPRFLKQVEREGLIIEPVVLIRQASVIEEELCEGNLDFAVIGGHVVSPYLSAEPLHEDRFLAVVNSEYDVPDRLSVEQLINYPLLLRERGSSSRDCIEEAAADRGLKVEPKMDSSNNQAIVTALYSSLGIGFLPESYVRGHVDRGRFKEITITDLEADRTNYLVMHKNKRLNDLQQQAYDLIKSIGR